MDVRKQPEKTHCPWCGDDSVHLESIRVNAGGQMTHITRDGIRVSTGEPEGRGALVETVWWCENGRHKWTRREHFHKGMTLKSEELLMYVHGNLAPELFPTSDL